MRSPDRRWVKNTAHRTTLVRCLLLALLSPIIVGAANAAMHEGVAAQFKKAAAYHEKSDYAHSIPLLRRLVQQTPRSYPANLLLGEDLFHSGHIREAIGPLEMACRVQPQDATAEVYLADASAALGDFSRASEALQAGIARSHGAAPFLEAWASYSLERYRLLGLSLRATRRGEAVALRVEAASHPEGSTARESLLNESANLDPEQPGIWGELGISQLEIHKREEVQRSLKEAQRREPLNSETLQLEALLAAAEQDWTEAEKRLALLGARSPAEMQSALTLWRHVLAVKPGSGGAIADCLRNSAALCSMVPRQPAGGEGLSAQELYAEGRWEQLIALPVPRAADHSTWLWRGAALAKIGHCFEAIPSLERGLEADELAAGFWLEICYSSEAERTVARLGMEKDQAAFHRLQGDLLLRLQGDVPAALLQYRAALKVHPKDPLLLGKLAGAQLQTGDFEAARLSAGAVLAIDNRDEQAMRILAQIAMANRDYERALPWLRKLVAETPDDRSAAVDLGKALAHTGQSTEALQWLTPALANGYPDEKGALHALEASVLRKLGRDAEAMRAETEARRLSDAYQASGTNGNHERPDANQ